jgi:peptidoglycan hydrolase CwlO-like protein
VQKVVQLLGDLQAKVVAEGEASQKTFQEFSFWCEDRARNVQYELKTAKSEVEELTAAIEHASSEITSLESKIEETAANIASNQADMQAAEAIRKKEKVDFEAEDKESADVISALERAIMIIEREQRKGGAAFEQINKAESMTKALSVMVEASMLRSQDEKTLLAMVQGNSKASADDEEDNDLIGAPDPATYKSHSGSILDTLDGLLEKAKDMLETSRTKEANAQHNFNMLQQSITDELKFSGQDMDTAKKNLASNKEAKAGAEGDLVVTQKVVSEGTKDQGILKSDCMTRSQDYEAETKSRNEELKSLAAAKQAITESTGGADSITYAGSSFLQLANIQMGETHASIKTGADLANFEAVRYIRKLAREQKSQELMQLARRMEAAMNAEQSGMAGDPFAKVKELIKGMLETLAKDAETDASHKAYCDKELGETLAKKDEKEAYIDKLTAQIDSGHAKSSQLKEQVAALQKQLADLAASQAEMSKIRQEEKNLHRHNKAEMESGLEGVKMALRILREYYAKDSDHKAAGGAASGIVGMLEVVESDFTKNMAAMNGAELTAQGQYDRETSENEIERATKEKDVEYKNREATQLDGQVREATSDRDGAQTELSAVLEYKGQLLKMCVATPSTYEERKGRREAEIAGLKEALNILKGEAMLLQRQVKGKKLRGTDQAEPHHLAPAQ